MDRVISSEEGNRQAGRQEPRVRSRRRLAGVSSPAQAAARLTLSGVMDTEGRVDESRLRMHILQNGMDLWLSDEDECTKVAYFLMFFLNVSFFGVNYSRCLQLS